MSKIKNNDIPLVSIVTPSYNQGKYIERTIRSVLCQDYSNIEYIVVDGLSSDNSKKIIKKYNKYIDVSIIEKDNGQSDALNKGFKVCTGDILAYLNSDDCYPDKSTITKVVSYFEQYPDVDVIYGQRDTIDADGRFLYCMPYRPFSKKSIYISDYIPQECTFWRRNIFEKSGSYVDDTFDFAMDYELWLRFLKHDAIFLSVTDLFGLFRSYEGQKSISRWQTVGLPEIARLYSMYTNKHIPEKDMIDDYQKHFYGVDPSFFPESFNCAQQLWNTFVVYKRNVLGQRAIDEWVFQEEPNLLKPNQKTKKLSNIMD
jgi:glycosyltransferase involved in cell wall biosynthesis